MDRAPADLACELAALNESPSRHEDLQEALRAARAELATLRRSEQLLTATLDATSDGMLGLDEERRPVFFNVRFAELWGITEGGLDQADPGWLRAHQAARVRDPEALVALTQRSIASMDDTPALVELLDGRTLERRAFPKRVQGQCVGVVIVYRDVTASLRHERERRRQDATIASLMNSIPDPIFYKDRAGRYLGCNEAYMQLWGRAVADVRGHTCHDLFPPAEAAAIDARDAAALSSLHKATSENRIMIGSQEVLFETVVSPLWDEDGLPQGLVGISRNVTARKQAEEDSLQARRAAEDAAAAKADFLANISHEIRTPLNAVIGLADLLARTPLDERQRDYMDKVRTAGRHLLRLVDDVLDFSKIEAGQMDLEEQGFALDRLLDGVSSVVGEKCHAKGLEMVFEVAADVPAVLVGDSLRLQQVLLNYANNAVKFTERGEVVVGVERLPDAGEGVLLRFSVRDTGIGIDADQLHRLFRSFSQAESSISRRYGGTGLGLAICKRLAERMGGQVGVESEPGHGSLFWFTARLREGSPDAALAKALPMDVRGRRALVVDDNGPARTVTAEMLRRMGFEADEVASGEAALEALSRASAAGRAHDMVYLDWRMPGLDGIETARRIRALQPECNALVLMVTAYGKQEALQAASSAGIAAVVTKPLSPSVLLDATMEALCRVKPAARPAAPACAPAAGASGARVLLVEDNEINQLVAREHLLQAGAVVDVAGNGQEALDMLARERYDLVLMDMQMPVMDGLSATRALRRIERLRSLPVVGLTANALDSHRQACLDAGMNDFLVKPVDPARLHAALVRWTSGGAKAEGTGARATPAEATPLPRGIPGLDVDQGLVYAMGKEALYLQMLLRFAQSQGDLADRIRAALQSDDRITAERMAHTAVGTAGMLGAAPVAQAAQALERSIGAGDALDAIEPLVGALEQVLSPLARALLLELGPDAAAA